MRFMVVFLWLIFSLFNGLLLHLLLETLLSFMHSPYAGNVSLWPMLLLGAIIPSKYSLTIAIVGGLVALAIGLL